MNQLQFLMALNETKKAYSWEVRNGKIVGVARNGRNRGHVYNPIVAVARYNGLVQGNVRTRDAAKKLGMSTTLQANLLDAFLTRTNRGNAQVLRGRVRQVLAV